MRSFIAFLALVSALLASTTIAHADSPAPRVGAAESARIESEIEALSARVAEHMSQAEHQASNGAIDHVTHAIAAAREALAGGDVPRALRAVDVARVALLLAERQAARARALRALDVTRQARVDAESRRDAARRALESARADRGRLDTTP